MYRLHSFEKEYKDIMILETTDRVAIRKKKDRLRNLMEEIKKYFEY